VYCKQRNEECQASPCYIRPRAFSSWSQRLSLVFTWLYLFRGSTGFVFVFLTPSVRNLSPLLFYRCSFKICQFLKSLTGISYSSLRCIPSSFLQRIAHTYLHGNLTLLLLTIHLWNSSPLIFCLFHSSFSFADRRYALSAHQRNHL
jgi:hypothetical protein